MSRYLLLDGKDFLVYIRREVKNDSNKEETRKAPGGKAASGESAKYPPGRRRAREDWTGGSKGREAHLYLLPGMDYVWIAAGWDKETQIIKLLLHNLTSFSAP